MGKKIKNRSELLSHGHRHSRQTVLDITDAALEELDAYGRIRSFLKCEMCIRDSLHAGDGLLDGGPHPIVPVHEIAVDVVGLEPVSYTHLGNFRAHRQKFPVHAPVNEGPLGRHAGLARAAHFVPDHMGRGGAQMCIRDRGVLVR